MTQVQSKLVGSAKCLEMLFPDPESRPSTRWLDTQRKRGRVPFLRAGRLIFFDPVKVREALDRNCTVNAIA